MAIAELDCTVTIEHLRQTCLYKASEKVVACTVTLGRNEFGDIVIKISPGQGRGNRSHEIILKEVKLFKKFISEGKSTIRTQNKQLLISNCPPEQLARFLKVLAIKFGINKISASDRTKLYSTIAKQFRLISPLTAKDCNSYNRIHQQVTYEPAGQKPGGTRSSIGLLNNTPKRKRGNDGTVGLPRKRLNCDSLKDPKPRSTINRIMNSTLTKEQEAVLKAVLSGSNVFFTGSAGTGKSYLLKRIVGSLPPKATVIAASTGIAASHIGGITFHSFAGIGCGTASLETCYKLASRSAVKQQWKNCQYLIIDEVSMIEANYFDKVESVAQYIKKCSKPFGGIQLILCGDFLQLPPVMKGAKDKKKFCFQSASWKRCINSIFELTEVKRQEDPVFINMLQHIRVGKCPHHVLDQLTKSSSRVIERHGIQATRLCTHKVDVDEMNKQNLNNLKGETKVFHSVDSDISLSDQMDNLLPVRQRCELKVGAQVMLTKNLDIRRGLVNGARGVISGFQSDSSTTPVVKFFSGEEVSIKMERFSMAMPGGSVAIRIQLPLKLAWAISIHKSQGLTLDCVEVSLARVFEDGQAYVALSRARTLDGLRILDVTKDCFRANPDALMFYIKVRKQMRTESAYGKSDIIN